MEIKELYNTTQKDIDEKKHNIFIAICLGNKFFTKGNNITENVSTYLDWALNHTKEKVLILIADKIQHTNYDVRNNNTPQYNKRRVLRDGNILKEQVNQLIQKLPSDQQQNVKVIQWEEMEQQDPNSLLTTQKIHTLFKENKTFSDAILRTVKLSVTDKPFSEEQYLHLCNYVLDEWSVCYSGITYEETYYGLYMYPWIDETVEFIERIQKGKELPEITRQLPDQKVGLIIIR